MGKDFPITKIWNKQIIIGRGNREKHIKNDFMFKNIYRNVFISKCEHFVQKISLRYAFDKTCILFVTILTKSYVC